MKRVSWLPISVFLFAYIIRFLSVWPANTIIGFDQARDLFDAKKIITGDVRIIGPTAGNNPNLHHGVAWLYFIIPPLLISENPISVVLWNSLFNAGVVIAIYFLTKSLFKNKIAAIIASIITAVSYYYVQFSGWLSNPTLTLLTVPVIFYGIWRYYENKWWGLPLAMLFLGLSIQFELFFIYLIPTSILTWLILKPKFPSFKTLIYSLLAISLSLSSMIATEIKFHFAGVKSLLSAGSFVGGSQKFDYLNFFSLNFFPQNKNLDIALGIFVVGFFIYEAIQNSETRKRNFLMLLWLFSPITMLALGTHNAPWFLIGRPAAAIIMGSYILSKIKPRLLIVLMLFLICFVNIKAIKNSYGKGQPLLEPDLGAILSKQIAVMQYTHNKAKGNEFAIDTVTNPLYINAVWAWNYKWYARKYSYKPTWLGGDQEYPYNTLVKATGKEKYLFLIIDETPRIPPVYTQNAIVNLAKKAKLIEEKSFDGIKVLMWERKAKS